MNNLTLVIGNKNYSSWSMRAWLLMKHYHINFQEVRIPLDTDATADMMAKYSPSHRVPVLNIGPLTVWDSMAIAETVNERFLEGSGWPRKPDLRALGRSACAEMHSGFPNLRSTMPMNCRRQVINFVPDSATQAEIDRIQTLLSDCLQRSGGPYLLGQFSIADAYFAPVASRFRTYSIECVAPVAEWSNRLAELPAMKDWQAGAEAEEETIVGAEVEGYE